MQKFLSELQRRKVLRMASGYVVAGWIILQVALSLQAAMKLPDWFATIIVSLLIIGFPIAMVASWFFEITPEGIRRTVASGDGVFIKPQTTDIALAGALVVVLVVIVAQAVMPRGSRAGDGRCRSAGAESRACRNRSAGGAQSAGRLRCRAAVHQPHRQG